jgi:uncharacterized membrane protein
LISIIDCFQILKWLLVLLSLQLSAYILIKRSLPQYALALSFTTGLLFFTLISWYTSWLGIYPVYSFIVVILILTYGAVHYRKIFDNFRSEYKYYVLFLSVFLVVLAVRMYVSADISIPGHGEAFVDHAFMASIMRNPIVPPCDPWFAGYSLNFFYYLSYWLYGMLGLVSDIPSTIVFNLLSPTIAAVVVINLYALGEAFIPKLKSLPVVLLFSLTPGFFILLSHASIPNYVIFVQSLLFTQSPLYFALYLVARPHVFFMCIETFLIFLLAITYTKWTELDDRNKLVLLLLVSLGLGTIFPEFTWAAVFWWPLVVIFGIFLMFTYKDFGLFSALKSGKISVPVWTIAVLGIGALLYIPYILEFHNTSIQSFDIINSSFSFNDLLWVFGWFILCLVISLRKEIWKYPFLLIILIPFYLINNLAAGFLLYLIILVLLRRKDIFDFFVAWGLVILFFSLFFKFRDFELGNNTLFKLSMISWVLLGSGASIMIGREISAYIRDNNERLRHAIECGLLLILLITFVITGISFIGPSQIYSPTIDGSSWLKAGHPSDADGISFLNSLKGTHILVETNGTRSTYESRISTFTGFPTILGYEGHEFLWRTDHPAGWEDQRPNDIRNIYEDPNSTIPLMKKYHADLLYVGPTEREHYSVNLPKIGLYRIYQNSEVEIYELC